MVKYGVKEVKDNRLSLSLLAQAATYQLRAKLPEPINRWTAECMAQKLFSGIDGDIRVCNDTILVTFYNAPEVERLKKHYEQLPKKLEMEGIDPRVPWLYDFKVDFRFR